MAGDAIYSNPRAWRVRVAQAAIWGFGLIIVWLAFFSGSEFESVGEMIFVWFVAVAMVAIMAATELYLWAYVVAIERSDQGWRVTTLNFFGQRTFLIDPAQARLGDENNDHIFARVAVNNFWRALRIPARRLPLIIDTTPPARLNRAAFERAMRQR